MKFKNLSISTHYMCKSIGELNKEKKKFNPNSIEYKNIEYDIKCIKNGMEFLMNNFHIDDEITKYRNIIKDLTVWIGIQIIIILFMIFIK